MNEAVLRLALDSKDIFKLVITRNKKPNQATGLPGAWQYTLYSSRRWRLAYQNYNNAVNLPDVYEAYILDILVPSVFVENIPYDSLTDEILKQVAGV